MDLLLSIVEMLALAAMILGSGASSLALFGIMVVFYDDRRTR